MGNLVKTYPNFGPDFTITFDIKLTRMPAGWHNVLHMMGHPHCCNEGSRIPGVWLNSSYGKPYILIDIVMKGQLQKFSKVLEMNKKTFLKLPHKIVYNIKPVRANCFLAKKRLTCNTIKSVLAKRRPFPFILNT